LPEAFLRVASVQLEAFDLFHAEEALGHALKMIDQAARSKAQLLVLPECSYPAYYLDGWEEVPLRPLDEILAIFGEKARQHHLELVVGLAELYPRAAGGQGPEVTLEAQEGERHHDRSPAGQRRSPLAYNSAFYFDASGRVKHGARKQFLWHFDSRWFTPGGELATAQTDHGPAGIFICADGRVPEIARTLALQGSRLFLNSTNWVSSGRSWENLPNPQADYLMAVRALENNAWIVSANKVGMEQGAIVYCGKSQVTSPEGKTVAMASSWKPEILVYDLPREEGTGLVAVPEGPVDGRLDLKKARRPQTYYLLSAPLWPERAAADRPPSDGGTGVGAPRTSSAEPLREATVAAAVQVFLREGRVDWSEVENFLRKAQVLGAELVLFPEPEVEPVDPVQAAADLEKALELSARFPFLLGWVGTEFGEAEAVAGQGKEGRKAFRTAWLFQGGQILGRYRKVHLEEDEAGLFSPGDDYPVLETPAGRLGFVLGYEGLLPEVPRTLLLRGVDIILWPARFQVQRQHLFARARAMENKVFVVASNALWAEGSAALGGESLVVGPGGQVLAEAFPGRPQIITAVLQPALARYKEVVPGTNVLGHRRPELYQEITRHGR